MWYEVLPAFAIIAGAITVSGAGLKLIDYFECEGKVRFSCFLFFHESQACYAVPLRFRPIMGEQLFYHR